MTRRSRRNPGGDDRLRDMQRRMELEIKRISRYGAPGWSKVDKGLVHELLALGFRYGRLTHENEIGALCAMGLVQVHDFGHHPHLPVRDVLRQVWVPLELLGLLDRRETALLAAVCAESMLQREINVDQNGWERMTDYRRELDGAQRAGSRMLRRLLESGTGVVSFGSRRESAKESAAFLLMINRVDNEEVEPEDGMENTRHVQEGVANFLRVVRLAGARTLEHRASPAWQDLSLAFDVVVSVAVELYWHETSLTETERLEARDRIWAPVIPWFLKRKGLL